MIIFEVWILDVSITKDKMMLYSATSNNTVQHYDMTQMWDIPIDDALP